MRVTPNKFLNPAYDGAVLPILHLNGYKIANPALLARLPREELVSLLFGYGYKPHFVEGSEPEAMHRLMAATMDKVIEEIQAIQHAARAEGKRGRPRWPLIVQDLGFIDHVVNKKADIIRVRPMPTRCSVSPTSACAAEIWSTSSSPASIRSSNGSTWMRRSSTAPPASASGSGRATTAAWSPMW